VNSKKDFDDCTGFVESDEGESGPLTVSFDKVLHHDDEDNFVMMMMILVIMAMMVDWLMSLMKSPARSFTEEEVPFITKYKHIKCLFLQKGKYYFVCGVGGHCQHGNQKVIFMIIVVIVTQ